VRRWWDGVHRPIWWQKLPYLVLGLAAAVGAGLAQRSALDTMIEWEEWGLAERCVQAWYGLAFYIWKTLWPTRLVALYELPYQLNPLAPRYVASGLAVLAGAVAVILLRRRWPGLSAAALIYVLVLAPVLGFAQSGPQVVADKYSYVSCIPWAILAGGALLNLWLWRPRRAWAGLAGGVVAVVIGGLFIRTWQQTQVWYDSETLWKHALAAGEPSGTAHLNYGILLRQAGDVTRAIEHYQAAVAIRPDLGDAWYALGNARKQIGAYAEAEAAYREAVRFMTQKYRAYLNLGNLYYNNLGRRDEAIAAYRAAIAHIESHRQKMFSPWPYLALGVALRDQGDLEGARGALEVARRYRETKERAEAELSALRGD
jgi:Tfp pilus assembly protein PilF